MTDILSTFFYEKTSYEFRKKEKPKILLPEIFNQTKLEENNIFQIKKNFLNVNKIKLKSDRIKKPTFNENKVQSVFHKSKLNFNNFNKIKKLNFKEIQNNANNIINELLSNDFNSKEFLNKGKKNCLSEKIIYLDPYNSIENNFQVQPEKKELYKSYEFQIQTFGSEKNRKTVIKGINDYKFKSLYKTLKKPMINSLKKNNDKDINTLFNDINEINQNSVFSKIKKRNNKKLNLYSYKCLTGRNKKINFEENINEKIFKSLNLANNTLKHINNRSLEHMKILKKVNINDFL